MEDYIAKKLAEAKVKNLQKNKDIERKLKEKQEAERKLKEKQEAERKLKEKQEAERKLKEKQETVNKNADQYKVVKTMEQHQKELEEKIKRKVNSNKKKNEEFEIQKKKEENQKQAEQKIKDYQNEEQKLKDMMEGNHMKQDKKDEEKEIIEQPKIERKTIEEQAEENKQKALAKLGISESGKLQQETVFNNNNEKASVVNNSDIPKIVFIVPYRDRRQQRNFFINQMKVVLEDMPKSDYKIYYIHQKDERSFNRGAMRNIGFLILKDLYPSNYKDITVVFNDVDTMPYKKNFLNYFTTNGIVKHFYGFKYALGGIVSIKASDFEKTKGYPNFWAWGFEDNCLQARVSNAGLTIDRSQFYPLADKNIIQIKDDIVKSVSRSEYDAFKSDNGVSGFHSIYNLKYTINNEDGMIDVTNFDADTIDNKETHAIYDTSTKKHPFSKKRRGGRMAF
jgi:actin-related protein